MKRIKYPYFSILFLFILTLSIAGCDKDDTPVATNTLQDLISKDTSLSIFTEVLKRTHLSTFTTGPGPFTIFAPTNKAYKEININSVNDLSTIDSNTLVIQTTWLIAAGIKSSDLLVGSNLTITTQVGSTIFAQATADGTYFNGYKAKSRDIQATNGVLHILDNYMVPTVGNTTTTLGRIPTVYKLWLQAIAKAGTTTTAAVNRSTTTMLAPTNDAMIAAGYDSTTIAKSTSAAMTSLVKYHLIGTLYYIYALKSASYKTDQGTNITFNIGTTIKVTGKTNSANFIVPSNFTTTNGVIHTIDAVLKQ